METLNKEERRRQKVLERLQQLRPIDDDFMRCLFRDNIPLAELVLRIITGKEDLVITQCETQKDMKRLGGARTICLDVHAIDSLLQLYNVEIQRSYHGSEPKRARYHSSVLDVENLDAKQDFSELPETYVIFITEKDFFGEGKPIYRIERTNLDTGKPFRDGEHIIYVNGAYRGDSDIGRLMHDFSCTSAADMYFPLMAERTRYLKENREGVRSMCQVIEDLLKEEREETVAEVTAEVTERVTNEVTEKVTNEVTEKVTNEVTEKVTNEVKEEAVKKMLHSKVLPLEQIAEYLSISLEEVKNIQARQSA